MLEGILSSYLQPRAEPTHAARRMPERVAGAPILRDGTGATFCARHTRKEPDADDTVTYLLKHG